jgi:hypothetical protein
MDALRGGDAEETQYYIEWTAVEARPEIATELVDLQRIIVL